MSRGSKTLLVLLASVAVVAWLWTSRERTTTRSVDEVESQHSDDDSLGAREPASVELSSVDASGDPSTHEMTRSRVAATGPRTIRVQWPNGDPAGAEVDVAQIGQVDGTPHALSYETFSTDSSGVLEIASFADGTHVVVARALAEEGAFAAEPHRGGWWTSKAELVVPGTADLVLTLDPQASVRGRAVDGDGRPLTSFEVFVVPRDAAHAPLDGRQSFSWEFTSPDGRFELYGLFPGTWTVHAEAALHWDSAHASVDVPHDAEMELVLERGLVLRGRVVEAGGEPLNGCFVRVTWPASARGRSGQREARTFSDGSFEFERVAPVAVELEVRRAGIETRTWTVDLTGGELRRDLELEVVRSR